MTPLTLVAIAVVVGIVLRQLLQSCYSTWSVIKVQLRVPPSPVPTNLFLGHFPTLRDRAYMLSDEFIFHLTSVLPRISRWRIGFIFPMYHVLVYHPKTVGPVLRSSMPKLDFMYDFLRPFIGNGLLISHGAKWSRDRRLLTPAFHFDILKPYTEVYVQAAEAFLGKFSRQIEAESAESIAVNVSRPVTLLTLDVMLRCSMSYDSHCQQNDHSEYANAVMDVTRLARDRVLSIRHWPSLIFPLTQMGREFNKGVKICHDFCRKVIQDRRKMIEEIGELKLSENRRHLDFLDILLTAKDHNGKGLTEGEILDQVGTFLFEGHDTTASALQWAFYFLARNQEVQNRARQEAIEVISDGHLRHEHMQKLQFITRCIKETLRRRPPVTFFGRELTEDMVIDGYKLPKGMEVLVSSLTAHHHPEVWSEPMKFDPDRFLPERIGQQHAYAFFPFSAGPRNCIGQVMAMDEMRAVLAMSLMKFRFDVDPDAHESIVEDAIIMRARGGIPLRISRFG